MSQSCACSLFLRKINEKDACFRVPQSSSLPQSCAKEKSSGVEIVKNPKTFSDPACAKQIKMSTLKLVWAHACVKCNILIYLLTHALNPNLNFSKRKQDSSSSRSPSVVSAPCDYWSQKKTGSSFYCLKISAAAILLGPKKRRVLVTSQYEITRHGLSNASL